MMWKPLNYDPDTGEDDAQWVRCWFAWEYEPGKWDVWNEIGLDIVGGHAPINALATMFWMPFVAPVPPAPPGETEEPPEVWLKAEYQAHRRIVPDGVDGTWCVEAGEFRCSITEGSSYGKDDYRGYVSIVWVGIGWKVHAWMTPIKDREIKESCFDRVIDAFAYAHAEMEKTR